MAVYFLADTTEGKKEKRSLYVGKTSTGMTRFFSHKRNKEWWDKVFFFTAEERVFDEDTILGLENLLITKYKASNLYIMQQEGSNKPIDEDCEFFAEQIIGIMDFLGYEIETDLEDDSDNVLSEKESAKVATETSKLFDILDIRIKELSPNISSDKMKLYTAYKYGNRNICAVWVQNKGLEVELYIRLEDITAKDTGAFDITNRKRGNRESAVKIRNSSDLNKALAIIKQIANTVVD